MKPIAELVESEQLEELSDNRNSATSVARGLETRGYKKRHKARRINNHTPSTFATSCLYHCIESLSFVL